MLDGEVEVVADGARYTLRPGDVFWTGVGCIHAFYETKGNTVLWLETSAPGPPDRHSYRFERDWQHLEDHLRAEASVRAGRLGFRHGSVAPRPAPGGLRAFPDRRAAPRGAPEPGPDGTRRREARRRLAEPDLADRARQGEPVGEHALGTRDGARPDDERPLLRGRRSRSDLPSAPPAALGRAADRARVARGRQPRLGRSLGAADGRERPARRVPLRRLSRRRRILRRGLARPPRRQGVRLHHPRPARRAHRLRRVRARARHGALLRLVVARIACGRSATRTPRRSGSSSAGRATAAAA